MDRRKFLARLAQLAAGATVAATGAELLAGAVASNTPRSLDFFPGENLPYSAADIEKDLMDLWARYRVQPDVIIVSPDVYQELLDLAGFDEACQGKFDRFEFAGVSVRRHPLLSPNTGFRLRHDLAGISQRSLPLTIEEFSTPHHPNEERMSPPALAEASQKTDPDSAWGGRVEEGRA